jgi:hypothetical protein
MIEEDQRQHELSNDEQVNAALRQQRLRQNRCRASWVSAARALAK